MNETLREKEELSRVDAENLRKYRDEIVVLRKKVEQHSELMAEKDHTAQVSLRVGRQTATNMYERCVLDPTRRDQHSAARARPDRRAQPEPDKGQCKAIAALARCEASGGGPYERGERVLRGDAVASASSAELASGAGGERRRTSGELDGVGKRGGEDGDGSNDDEGWDAISRGDGRESDTEWLIVDDE